MYLVVQGYAAKEAMRIEKGLVTNIMQIGSGYSDSIIMLLGRKCLITKENK